MTSSNTNVTIDDLVIDPIALYETVRKSSSRDPFDHYVNGICGLFICLLGTISNALSFSVLIRRTMHLSTYVYLAGLCLSDFTACLFLIPGYVLDAYPIDVPAFELPRSYAYTQMLIIAGAISTTARALSIWLCVAFTIDRWIMICRPFIGPQYCTMKNARIVTLLIYVVGFFYAIPLMFEYEPHEELTLSEILFVNQQKKIYHRGFSSLGKNAIFRWAYVLINAIGVYVIPLTTIAILNRKLLTSIRLLEQRSAEFNAPLPTKQGVTAMLLATTIMLLVFRAPSATVSIMWITSAKMFINERPPFILRKFHSLANLSATLNAATTFIMFIIYGTKFRSEFTRIYCRYGCCVKNENKNGTMKAHQPDCHEMKSLFKKDNEQPKRDTLLLKLNSDKGNSDNKVSTANGIHSNLPSENDINSTLHIQNNISRENKQDNEIRIKPADQSNKEQEDKFIHNDFKQNDIKKHSLNGSYHNCVLELVDCN